jgi:hypothetical protein
MQTDVLETSLQPIAQLRSISQSGCLARQFPGYVGEDRKSWFRLHPTVLMYLITGFSLEG